MPEINYKQKYLELKQKYMNAVDTAFRLGYEQGSSDAQQQAMQDQMAAQQAAEEAAAQGGGMPGEEGGAPAEGAPGEEQAPESANPGGSELDQHIAQLESMLGKSELTGEDLAELKKSVDSLKQGIEIRKSEKAIKGIAKALKTPKSFQLSKTAAANLTPTAKAAVSMQEKIVTDVMKAWEEEEQLAKGGISGILAKEGLLKKE